MNHTLRKRLRLPRDGATPSVGMARPLRHALAIGALAASPLAWAADAASSAAAASAASDTAGAICAAGSCKPLPVALSVCIMIGMAILLFVGLLMSIKALRLNKDWSLGKALSEEAKLPDGTPPPPAGELPPLIPSSSRLIALLGTIILGTFYTGIGFYVVWQLCNGARIDAANSAWAFFVSGATLFLPYGANKAASMLQIK
jgi:hypothetical protein